MRGSASSQKHGRCERAGPKPAAQIKKQTRRRVHASRPYQERLLNMAEARREIVTALRIHRATMRQQSKYHQLEQREQPRLRQPAQVVFQEQRQSHQAFQGAVQPVAMSYYYASSSSSNNHLCSSPLANLISGGNYYSSSMLSYHLALAPLEEEAPAAAAAAIGGLQQLPCSLPAKPLGLNLSFHDGFGGSLDNVKNCDDNPFGVFPLIQSSSSCPASSYSAYSSPVMAMAGHGYSSADAPPAALSQVLEVDGEMLYYTIGSDGERQGMESGETDANAAAASARWTRILESGGDGGRESAGAPTEADPGMADYDVDMVVAAGFPDEWQWLRDGVGVEQEVPAWRKPDILLETVHADDGGDHSGCYEGGRHVDSGGGDDFPFPCMDIGDIEGWGDGEWFP